MLLGAFVRMRAERGVPLELALAGLASAVVILLVRGSRSRPEVEAARS